MFQMFLWGVNEAFHPLMGPLGLQLSIFYFKGFSFSKDQYLVPRKDTKNSSNIKESITVYLEGWYVGNEISSGVWANFKFSTTLNFLFKMQSRKKKSCHVTNIKIEGGPSSLSHVFGTQSFNNSALASETKNPVHKAIQEATNISEVDARICCHLFCLIFSRRDFVFNKSSKCTRQKIFFGKILLWSVGIQFPLLQGLAWTKAAELKWFTTHLLHF